MLKNHVRLLYSFGGYCVKSTTCVLQYNTQLKQDFCTEKQELKPEDTFGSYSSSKTSDSFDSPEDECSGTGTNALNTILQMKNHINAYEFENASEVFNEYRKRKTPPPFMYKLMLASAAKLGRAEEAYSLYNDLKRRQLYADNAMFTSLFYACAKCPQTDVALRIADKVTEFLFKSEKCKPNKRNFNSMLMAYGRHGDISTVFLILDKLEQNKVHLKLDTYKFVLESCLSDKNSGLRFALLIWHHILKKKINPDLYTFTVMARCIRDCSFGDVKLCEGFIKSLLASNKNNCSNNRIEESPVGKLTSGGLWINALEKCEKSDEQEQGLDKLKETINIGTDSERKQIETSPEIMVNQTEIMESAKETGLSSEIKHELQEVSQAPEEGPTEEIKSIAKPYKQVGSDQLDELDLPNLLILKSPGESIIKYDDFSTSENRLLLFGGLKGFLNVVTKYNVKPDIVLFSVLLSCIPSRQENEEMLMKEMKKFKVKVDTVFMNILINKRILRNEESMPQDYLDLMKSYKVAPDIVTIGTIARSCVTHESGKQCIQIARSHKIRLNNTTLLSLLMNASKISDLNYVHDILQTAKEDDVDLDTRFVTELGSFIKSEKIKRSQTK